MSRTPGYYWVVKGEREPETAYWDGEIWCMLCSAKPFDDKFFDYIGDEMIPIPDANSLKKVHKNDT